MNRNQACTVLLAYLKFFTIQAEQLRPIHPSGSEFCGVLVHVHGHQPQLHLLGVPLQDGSALPQVVVVVDGGNRVTVQRLAGHRGNKRRPLKVTAGRPQAKGS